jgi:hypothetical protein
VPEHDGVRAARRVGTLWVDVIEPENVRSPPTEQDANGEPLTVLERGIVYLARDDSLHRPYPRCFAQLLSAREAAQRMGPPWVVYGGSGFAFRVGHPLHRPFAFNPALERLAATGDLAAASVWGDWLQLAGDPRGIYVSAQPGSAREVLQYLPSRNGRPG